MQSSPSFSSGNHLSSMPSIKRPVRVLHKHTPVHLPHTHSLFCHHYVNSLQRKARQSTPGREPPSSSGLARSRNSPGSQPHLTLMSSCAAEVHCSCLGHLWTVGWLHLVRSRALDCAVGVLWGGNGAMQTHLCNEGALGKVVDALQLSWSPLEVGWLHLVSALRDAVRGALGHMFGCGSLGLHGAGWASSSSLHVFPARFIAHRATNLPWLGLSGLNGKYLGWRNQSLVWLHLQSSCYCLAPRGAVR
jgi:hypothetical protein